MIFNCKTGPLCEFVDKLVEVDTIVCSWEGKLREYFFQYVSRSVYLEKSSNNLLIEMVILFKKGSL